jgi:two-component system, chemotaxis family, sensor kinase CheA
MQWTRYLFLPAVITPFERQFLDRLNRIALVFFCCHVPVLMAVAWLAGTGPLSALSLSLAVLTGPVIAKLAIRNPRWLSVVYGITAMLMGGLLVHFGQGPVQIEMHFYFFALLAMLCMFANPAVNIAACLTVALHHGIVWWLLPQSVFNYDAQWWVVLVHAGFVLLETVAACYISRQFFDNVIGLEMIVEARTATIHQQQQNMSLILNTLEEGLVTIDLSGKIRGELSRAAKAWFGPPTEGDTFASWIGHADPAFGEWFDLSLESLREAVLPPEVTLGQLPARLNANAKTYSVHYQQIAAAETLGDDTSGGRLLVIITDVTEKLRMDAVERHQGELVQLFQHMMRDRAGFLEFLREADSIVAAIQTRQYSGLEQLQRLVHTLKGNSAIFGMRRVSEACHNLENHIAEQGGLLGGQELSELQHAWWPIRSDIDKLTGTIDQTGVEIAGIDYELILKALRDGVDVATISRMIESWRLEPAAKKLESIEHQLLGIAEQLGKDNLSVVTEPNGVRFDRDHFSPFWSAFVHVLRNSVDHGIESEFDRQKAGKPAQSVIRVATAVQGERFVVTIEDDGPGVDWDRLRAKARRLGLGGNTLAEPSKLLFLSGVSSKDSVTDMSGRGIGMGAVAEACAALGGAIEVNSKIGVGTRVEFAFPKEDFVYAGDTATLQSVYADSSV